MNDYIKNTSSGRTGGQVNRTVDNRNLSDMTNYYEARVELLKKRVDELTKENAELTRLLSEKWERVQ